MMLTWIDVTTKALNSESSELVSSITLSSQDIKMN